METWSIQRLNRQILCWFAAAAAAAKSLQSCPTLCDPRDSSPRGPMPLPTPSLGFSRQEHWRGVPLPSPMHESEKWEWSCSVVSNSSWPHGLQPTRRLRPWDSPRKSTGVGCSHYLKVVWLYVILFLFLCFFCFFQNCHNEHKLHL